MTGRKTGGFLPSDLLRSVLEFSPAPTLVVSSSDNSVLYANLAAHRFLADFGPGLVGSVVTEMGGPDDVRWLRTAIEGVQSAASSFQYLMFRFVPPSGQTVSTEMAVTSCGSSDIVGSAVVLQFRNVTNVDSLASMIGLVADMPVGDVLMTALRRGPLAGLPVDTVSFYSVHPDEEVLRLRGGSGFDEQLRKEFGVLPVNDRHPMGQAVLSGESFWTGLTALFERFPFAANDARRLPAYGRGEAVCMPIVSRASVIGTWFTVFSTPVHQTIARLEKFRAIGHLLGHWLLMSSGQGAVLQTVPRSMPFHTSERELVILRLIEDGKSNLQIAQELGYSEATVRADLSRLYRRLGVAGRREVVAKAREVGLYAG